MSPGFIVWFTGLSGSGKSTLAALVSDEIRRRGIHVECLDGDEVRKNLSWGLGFSQEDRNRNVERIGYVARMVARSGSCAITAAISPYRSVRDGVRAQSERFCEIYCECPISILSDRDPKGLYKRALAGEIKNFTGVDDPYEEPINPDVHLHTDQDTPESCAAKIVDHLEAVGFLEALGKQSFELPAPYGGEITDVPEHKLSASLKDAEVSQATAHCIAAMAAGYLSPVRGFMSQREASRVVKGQRLEQGLPWQEPILLELCKQEAEDFTEGESINLTHGGQYLGRLQVQQIWQNPLGVEEGLIPWRLAGILIGVAPAHAATPSVREVRRSLDHSASQTIAAYFASSSDLEKNLLSKLRLIAKVCGSLLIFSDELTHADFTRVMAGSGATVICYPGGVSPKLRSVVAQNAGATTVLASLESDIDLKM